MKRIAALLFSSYVPASKLRNRFTAKIAKGCGGARSHADMTGLTFATFAVNRRSVVSDGPALDDLWVRRADDRHMFNDGGRARP